MFGMWTIESSTSVCDCTAFLNSSDVEELRSAENLTKRKAYFKYTKVLPNCNTPSLLSSTKSKHYSKKKKKQLSKLHFWAPKENISTELNRKENISKNKHN